VTSDDENKNAMQAALALFKPRLGVWEHHKGGLYIVFAVTLKEDTLDPMVSYYSIDKKTRWTRTYENFVELIGEGKRPRFSYVRPVRSTELLTALGLGGDES
jgi:hypothetical protein